MNAGKVAGWLNAYGQTASRWLRAIPRLYRMVLLTAVIVGIGVLLVQTTMAQRTARTAALSQSEAQSALEALSHSLIDAETGQRGYLLTLNPVYLEPYERARRQLPDRLAAVKMMFMQNTDPAVSAHAAALDGLVAGKLDELGSTINSARNGDQAGALQIVNEGRGKTVMATALAYDPEVRRAYLGENFNF